MSPTQSSDQPIQVAFRPDELTDLWKVIQNSPGAQQGGYYNKIKLAHEQMQTSGSVSGSGT